MSDGNYYWNKYKTDVEGDESISLNYEWEHTNKPRPGEMTVFVHNYLSASDYSSNDGGVVASNIRAFKEAADSDYLGTLYWNLYGGHGGMGIAVLADVLDTDSALYVANEDQKMIDAANTIREMIDSLDSYPILDEDDHSNAEMEIEQEQFGPAMFDIWVSPHEVVKHEFLKLDAPSIRAEDRQSGFHTTFPRLIAAAMANTLPDGDQPNAGRSDDPVNCLREAETNVFVEDSLAAFYRMGGDLFSVNPYIEGSGDNLQVLFYFDKFVIDFHEALSGLAWVQDQEQNSLLDPVIVSLCEKISAAFFETDGWKAFEYNSPIYRALREGRNLYRLDQSFLPVLADAAMIDPARAQQLVFEGKFIEQVQAGGFKGLRS